MIVRLVLCFSITGLGCSSDSSSPAPSSPPSDSGSDSSTWPALPECRDFNNQPQPQDQLHGSNGSSASYRLWRCATGMDSGHTAVYRADAFEIKTASKTYRATGSEISYKGTHHNWYDTSEAKTADAVLKWRTNFDVNQGEVQYFVSVSDLAGKPILAELEVK